MTHNPTSEPALSSDAAALLDRVRAWSNEQHDGECAVGAELMLGGISLQMWTNEPQLLEPLGRRYQLMSASTPECQQRLVIWRVSRDESDYLTIGPTRRCLLRRSDDRKTHWASADLHRDVLTAGSWTNECGGVDPFEILIETEFLEAVHSLYSDFVMMHAAALWLEGTLLVIAAPSGGGKTSLALIAQENGFTVIADDLLLLKKDGKAVTALPRRVWPRPGCADLIAQCSSASLSDCVARAEHSLCDNGIRCPTRLIFVRIAQVGTEAPVINREDGETLATHIGATALMPSSRTAHRLGTTAEFLHWCQDREAYLITTDRRMAVVAQLAALCTPLP